MVMDTVAPMATATKTRKRSEDFSVMVINRIRVLKLYVQTLRHLKPVQLWYQIYYRLCNKRVKFSVPQNVPSSLSVRMNSCIPTFSFYSGNRTFEFLNRRNTFEEIDWNFSDFGKLWTYNLNYFEFLNQENFQKEEGLQLIRDFISKKQTHKDGYEPYPVSLRIINWVKFLSRYGIHEEEINRQLYSDCIRLTKNLEYHLLANHLLENGFGLLFGAYYFRDDTLYRKAAKIIRKELKEQILSDGAHYELSPMYHQIILSRVLDSYNLVTSNTWGNKTEIEVVLNDVAQKMISWMENISFNSGEIPMVNDASPGIAPETGELLYYARWLNITKKKILLGESGYRMFKNDRFELLFDVGQISPAYQPGHSHADSLNFILHIEGAPCIVDTGVSTYEKNERRQYERSTAAHNTLVANNENSSQVWGGFRVGKRAKTTILHESTMSVTAQHDGYRHLGIMHQRSFEITSTQVTITDKVEGRYSGNDIRGYIHFHPDTYCVPIGNQWLINERYVLEINPDTVTSIESYQFADGFNRLREAQRLVYQMIEGEKTISIYRLSKKLFIHEDFIPN